MVAKIDADWPLPPAGDALSRADANPNADPNLPPYAGNIQQAPAYDPRVPR
jgi:hypothetical protein